MDKVYKISYIDRTDNKRHHIFIKSNEINIHVLAENEINEIVAQNQSVTEVA